MRYKDGKEYLDDTPVEMPAGFKRPESIHDMIKRYIRSEQFNAQMAAQGKETEDEANDFEVEDDNDPLERFITAHELSALAAEELREIVGEDEFRRAKQQLQREYDKRMMASRSNSGPEKEKQNGAKQESSGVRKAGVAGDRGGFDGATKVGDEAGG